MLNNLFRLVDYILMTELQSFEKNPTRNHIYYLALVLRAGEDEAERVLSKTLSLEKSQFKTNKFIEETYLDKNNFFSADNIIHFPIKKKKTKTKKTKGENL